MKRAKRDEIIVETRWYAGSVTLPRPKLGVWFNCSVRRGDKANNCVVSPSDFVTMSQSSFHEICQLSTNDQLTRLRDMLGDNKKANVFRAIIDAHLEKS